MNYLEDNRDYMVKLLDRLLRTKTVNPPGNEMAAAKVVIEELEKIGVSYKTYARAARHKDRSRDG